MATWKLINFGPQNYCSSHTWTVFWNLSVMAFLKSSADVGSSDLMSWYLSSRSDQSFITCNGDVRNVWKWEYSQPSADTFILCVIYPLTMGWIMYRTEGLCLFPVHLPGILCNRVIFWFSWFYISFWWKYHSVNLKPWENKRLYQNPSFECYPNNQSKTSSRTF